MRKRWPHIRGRIIENVNFGWAWACRRWHGLSRRQQVITASAATVVLIVATGALFMSGRSGSAGGRNGWWGGVDDGRPRAVEQTVTDDAKGAKKAVSGVADLGDDAKRLAEAELTEMRLTRFNLPLTPGQEFILLDRERGFWQYANQLGTIGASAGLRQQKTSNLEALLQQRIAEGNGPAKAVRLQFARVESLGSEWSSYSFQADGTSVEVRLEGMPQNLLGRMVRGQDPTAADIAKMIHAAARLASVARRAAEFERQFNGLLVVTIGRTGVAAYYGRNDDATPETCLAERLDACSACVVGLYAHAKDTFDFFLGATPELPYRFEFPELSPDEMRRADALLKELAARRAAK
jgi:hypothetical protein